MFLLPCHCFEVALYRGRLVSELPFVKILYILLDEYIIATIQNQTMKSSHSDNSAASTTVCNLVRLELEMECQCLQMSLSGSCVVQNCPLDFSDPVWS